MPDTAYIVTVQTQTQYSITAANPDAAKKAAQSGNETPIATTENVVCRQRPGAPAAAPGTPAGATATRVPVGRRQR